MVEFCARESVKVTVESSGNEHLSIGEQCRRVKVACGNQASGSGPRRARWIVKFCAGKSVIIIIQTANDECNPIGQQCRRDRHLDSYRQSERRTLQPHRDVAAQQQSIGRRRQQRL